MSRAAQLGATIGVAVVFGVLVGVPGAVPVTEAGFSDVTGNAGNALDADTIDPPTLLVATDGVTVTLDWTATADTYASGHRILRSSSPGGPYSQIAEITPRTTATYVDSAPEGTHYYVARSFHGSWESANSNETSGWAWRPFDCPSDPDLRACIRFDTDLGGTYADESGYANTVVHTGGSQVPGISSNAAQGSPTAQYQMADSPSLDLTDAMTLETWVRFDSLPSTGRAGLIDNDGQYGLILYATTGLWCTNLIQLNLPHVPVPTGVWLHVACTWDGATLTMYFDGLPVASMASTGTMPTTDTDPVSLLDTSPLWDEPLDGAMDNVRIWHSARTQAQICADAGLTGC